MKIFNTFYPEVGTVKKINKFCFLPHRVNAICGYFYVWLESITITKQFVKTRVTSQYPYFEFSWEIVETELRWEQNKNK